MQKGAKQLYDKYLVTNCKFEINMPYDKKTKIIDKVIGWIMGILIFGMFYIFLMDLSMKCGH